MTKTTRMLKKIKWGQLFKYAFIILIVLSSITPASIPRHWPDAYNLANMILLFSAIFGLTKAQKNLRVGKFTFETFFYDEWLLFGIISFMIALLLFILFPDKITTVDKW